MRMLQLGILYSVAQAGLEAAAAPLAPADFRAEASQFFPGGGAGDLPAFAWKDYAPRVFASLRAAFGNDPADYLVSLTGGPALRELPSPGASGCIFFLSGDDRFLIKSVRKEEMGLTLGLLPRYHAHVAAHPDTLLVHFNGLHRVSPWLGRNARFLVMGNGLPTDRRVHRKYDLKGSTYRRTVGEGRRAADPGATLKDLDLDLRFELAPRRYRAVMAQLRADVALLQGLHVIDYSLLLGAHFCRWGDAAWHPPFQDWPEAADAAEPEGGGAALSSPFAEAARAAHGAEATTPGAGAGAGAGAGSSEEAELLQGEARPRRGAPPPRAARSISLAVAHSLAESLQQASPGGADGQLSRTAASVVEQADSVRRAARVTAAAAPHVALPLCHDQVGCSTLPRVQLGRPTAPAAATPPPPPAAVAVDSPAQSPTAGGRDRQRPARRSDAEHGCGWAVPANAVRTTSAGGVAREPVLLYFSLIDFLQGYRLAKRAEHAWKAMLHGETVSVSPPSFYGERFLRLMGRLFVEGPE
jgi:1-phosphatidylinositol-4-phosphate 5-kinase